MTCTSTVQPSAMTETSETRGRPESTRSNPSHPISHPNPSRPNPGNRLPPHPTSPHLDPFSHQPPTFTQSWTHNPLSWDNDSFSAGQSSWTCLSAMPMPGESDKSHSTERDVIHDQIPERKLTSIVLEHEHGHFPATCGKSPTTKKSFSPSTATPRSSSKSSLSSRRDWPRTTCGTLRGES